LGFWGYLIAEGISPETIIKTGSHMREVLDFYMPQIQSSEILKKLHLQPNSFFVVSIHREENVDTPSNLIELIDSLNSLAEHYLLPVIVSTHPRTSKRLDDLPGKALHPLVQYAKPFGFFDYNKLQMEAFCVVSDSGTISEESSLLNLPAVTIRNAHERPEGMDVGVFIMAGIKKDRILDAVKVVTEQRNLGGAERILPPVEDYEAQAVSKKILRIVMSYTDYINRTVWYKT